MKKISMFLVVIGAILVATNPPTATAQESGGLKISPSSELPVTRVFESTDGQFNFKNFEVEGARVGNYYTEFWLLPAKYADGNYTPFTVYVNGERVGKITPKAGNWQSARIECKETLELREGKNVISISTAVPEIPAVETLKIAANDLDACISSDAYDEYLEDAEFGVSDEISEELNDGVMYGNSIITPDFGYAFASVPTKYTFYGIYSFLKGQDIVITSTSTAKHNIDVVYYGSEPNPTINPGDSIIGPIGPIDPPGPYNAMNYESINSGVTGTNPKAELSYVHPTSAEMQGYGWLAPSEESINSTIQTALAKIKIPKSGRYLIRVRHNENSKSAVANINVNGVYYYDNVPISLSYRECTIPADGKEYEVMAICRRPETGDPYLFIHGADCSRVVGFNDDTTSPIRESYNLKTWDSYISQVYSVKTSGISVSNYSSISPTSYNNILVREKDNTVNFEINRKSKGNDFTEVSDLLIFDKSIVISGGDNLDGNLSIVADSKIKDVRVYSIEGNSIGAIRGNKSSMNIPVPSLNITRPGVYIVMVETQRDVTTKKIVVRQ